MIDRARQLGLKVMIGCFTESTMNISAAAQLLPLADYADLDGALLLADDVAAGVRIDRGRAVYPRGRRLRRGVGGHARSKGKAMTSRTSVAPAANITRRSSPNATPTAGGRPASMAAKSRPGSGSGGLPSA